MATAKNGRKNWSTTPNISWTKQMVMILCQSWETMSPADISEKLSTKAQPITPEKIVHMVQVLRAKGVAIPHKRKNGVYQILVDEFLADHPEFAKKKK